MKKTSLALILILALCVSSTVGIHSVKSSSITIVVPDDYSSIQQAINSANDGATVFVKKGIYNETLVINKSISLIGQDRNHTIIDGHRAYSQVILVQADNATVANFTLGNSDFHPITDSGWYQQNGEGDGIRIYPAGWPYPQYIKIMNNTIIGCPFLELVQGLHGTIPLLKTPL